ncbi:MAG: aspartate aminotransferase family protein [Anaerolineae bacterium]|nr:aspartate aminotransferase family protein [Anaerolineae bacterium]
MRDLLRETADRAARYLDGFGTRRIAPDLEAVGALERFREPLPEAPSDPAETLRLLDEIGSPATTLMGSGRYFGFVIGSKLPAALASNWLATAWDNSGSYWRVSPAPVMIENVALGWLLDVLGLPADCGGSFVTGATMANLTGIAAGRHVVLRRAGWDVEADGLFGAPPITVVVGEEVHPTLVKSLGLLGLGRNRVVRVPVDDQGRMRADAFPRLAAPAIVCLQAGNVNTGAFDPAAEIIPQAREAGAWVHVDGAFGLWAAAAPARAHLMRGYEAADSWATDAHKWLNVPYDSGLTFTRDTEALRAAMSITAAYLPAGDQREPAHYTPELSRRARGIDVWAALRSLGRSGVADLVERCCRYATRFADELRAAGYEILNEVVINQVLVSFGDPETTNRVIQAIQQEGTCWAGGTVWQGRTAMRISVSSWETTEEDVERSLEAILRIAGEVRAGQSVER